MKTTIIITAIFLIIAAAAMANPANSAMFNLTAELNKPVNDGNITVTSSVSPKEYLYDNKYNSQWISSNTPGGHNATIDLGEPYNLSRFWIQTRKVDDYTVCFGNFSIEYSLNSIDWTDWSGSINQSGTPPAECNRADPSALPNINYYNFTNFSVYARYVMVKIIQPRSDSANNEAKIYEIGISAVGGSHNLTATNKITGLPVDQFNVFIGNTSYGSTTNGHIHIPILAIKNNYTMIATSSGYAPTTESVYASNLSNNHTFSFYGSNSITINIFDEAKNTLINQSTISFTSDTEEFSNITNGSIYLSNLTLGIYTVTASATGYNTRSYQVTIQNNNYQTLNTYLPNSSTADTTIFTVSDDDTGDILPNVSSTMYKIINGTWTTIEHRFSDISGSIQFSYLEDINYRFFLSKDGYNDNTFNLNPILYSTYNIKMKKSTTIPYEPDFDGISIHLSPQTFKNHQTNPFTFTIYSPTSNLINYGINITYPNSAALASGTNPAGGTLSTPLTIESYDPLDTVRLDYYYTTTISGRRNFTAYFPIITTNGTGYNQTFIANRDQTYGLGIFERVFITTIAVIFILGIATMIGQVIPGLALSLLTYGYMAYIGFIPLWIILPTMFIGFLFISWKSGGF